MQTHMNFDYQNSSFNNSNKKMRRVVMRRRGRNILVILGVSAFIITFFFLKSALQWLSFTERIQQEALLFAMTSFPGFIFIKLTELEIIMSSTIWKWHLPNGRLNRSKVKAVTTSVALLLTLAIFMLEWWSSGLAFGSWIIGLVFSAG